MHCKRCRYPLTSLAEHRCPECGKSFDPDDPASYMSKVELLPWYKQAWFINLIVILNVIVIVLAALYVLVYPFFTVYRES